MNGRYRDFLPAVLEVQETPPSPAGRIIMWAVMILLVLAVCWAAWGKIDIVAVTRGRVVVSLLSRPVSSALTADIAQVFIQEGQQVEKDQLLIQLNDSLPLSRRQENILRQQINTLNILRLDVLLRRLRDMPVAPGSMQALIADADLGQQILARLEAESEADRREKERYMNNRLSLQALMEGYLAQQEMAQEQLPIYQKQYTALEQLLRRGSTSEDSLLEIRKQLLDATYSAKAARAKVREAQANYHLSETEEAGYIAGRLREMEQERSERITENALLASQLQQLDAELELYQLRAPVSGKVDSLVFRDAGAAVEAAQELLKIVPDGENLSAEVWVSNKDVGFLRVGQAVTVKVDTFDFTRYGWVEGTLGRLSADAVEDRERGLLYKAVIQLKEKGIVVDGTFRPLEPGMSVSAEIRTGKRTLLSYLLSPVLEAMDDVGKQR